MANKDNQSQRFIYIRSLKEKVPCTEQQFQEFYREATRIRKKEQYYHRCKFPKQFIWTCDGDCENCEHHLECHARTVNELDLQEIVLIALNELLGDKSKYQKQLQQNIASVIRASAAITTDGIDEKLMELQQELVKKANNKEAYDEIADQIFALREKRQQASMDTVQRDEQLQRITELQDFIKDQSSDLTVFDEALVKRWLKQIVIWPTHCTVELKSGLKVDVEI